MYENEHHPVFSDGEGPFVTGALSGEQAWEAEEPQHEADMEAEYPEIYSEGPADEAELYEGPRHHHRHHRRPPRPVAPVDPGDEEGQSRESPFLDEEEIVRELSGQAMPARGGPRCACGRTVRAAPPPRRRPAPPQEHEGGGRPTLSSGDRGQAVLDLQSSLSRLGISPGPLDGIFGSKTDSAVRTFQSQRGIEVDGVVGPITWGEIDKALGGAPPAPTPTPTPTPGTGGPSGSAAAIVAEARKHLGYKEIGTDGNMFSAYFGRPPEWWCADFVSYVHTKAGIPLNTASTVWLLSYVKRIGRFSTSNPAPGDIMILDEKRGDNKPASHVGIVESVSGDTFTTIDGNWSQKVSRVQHSLHDPSLVGFGRLWTTAGTVSPSTGTGTGTGTSTGTPPCANAKPTTTVNPYLTEFTAAAAKAGVPSSWAQSPGLIQLVGHESSWKPTAKNPRSSAFGLFQFIRDTWNHILPEVPYGTTDVTWQAVGGFRYIKARYGTPDRAWAFWQATVCKNASLAPAELQKLARFWISKGMAGY